MAKTEQLSGSKLQFIEFIEEFMTESDRSAVILGAAKLDLLLYQLRSKYFVPFAGSKDELLDGDSPLGTFSAKIQIAFRLGLIDADFARALHMIRKIRNAFAHEVAGCNLDSGAHRDRVKELIAPISHLATVREGLTVEEKSHSLTGAGAQFRVVLGLIAIHLEQLHYECVPINNMNAVSLVDSLTRVEKEKKDK